MPDDAQRNSDAGAGTEEDAQRTFTGEQVANAIRERLARQNASHAKALDDAIARTISSTTARLREEFTAELDDVLDALGVTAADVAEARRTRRLFKGATFRRNPRALRGHF